MIMVEVFYFFLILETIIVKSSCVSTVKKAQRMTSIMLVITCISPPSYKTRKYSRLKYPLITVN